MSILGYCACCFALIAALILCSMGYSVASCAALRVSQQLQSIASGGRLPERVELGSDKARNRGPGHGRQ